MRFLITGGTGFIGKKLCHELKDHEIFILTRNKNLYQDKTLNYINNIDQRVFDYDIIINLAGEPISQYWFEGKKKEIYNSRILLTKEIANHIKLAKKKPSLFITGSAIGYYGIDNVKCDENDEIVLNNDLFSQKICHDWESAVDEIKKLRIVKIRTGIVLGREGGILKKMLPPFKLGLGGKIGRGEQYISWIDINDLIKAILYIIDNDTIFGAINLTSPNPVTNGEFSKELAKLLKRPCVFDMPKILVEILFGQMGKELLLGGKMVYPKKLLESGFKFDYDKLTNSLSRIIK